jgi:hypothetical protein
MTTQTARMEFYDAKISSIDGNYEMNVNLTKVDKTELLSINSLSGNAPECALT